MTLRTQQTCSAIAPFAVWMALLMALPVKAEMYAVRTAVVGLMMLVLCLAFRPWREAILSFPFLRSPDCLKKVGGVGYPSLPLVLGVVVGLVVLKLWIWPEQFEWYRRFCIIGDQSTVALRPDSELLLYIQLIGSAFVIAPAEELFYRYFLYRWLDRRAGHWTEVSGSRFDFQAFLLTATLFSLGHNRIVAGFVTGCLYGLLAIKAGLGASIVAHMTTNFALGMYVIESGNWQFW